MTRRDNIGGALTMDAYAALAQQHRPTDAQHLQAEVCRLHLAGHSPIWISESLRIDLRQVEKLLKVSP